MARPPLVLETWGKIRRTTINGIPTAVASYRDSDGKTRVMQRQGKTPAAAERTLVEAMKARIAPVSEITRETLVRALADLWWEEYSAKRRAQATFDRYQHVLDLHVLPAIGGLRLAEVSVSRLDRFVKALAKNSAANAKIAHVVLLGMFDMAARHGAYEVSPARSIAPVEVDRKPVAAWTLDDVAELRQLLRAWDAGTPSRGKRFGDLADVADFFLATGCRPGEVFAVGWAQVDLDASPAVVSIVGTVTRGPKGGPARVVQPFTKSESGMRDIPLPPFAEAMLQRRRLAAYTEWVFPSSTGTLRAPGNFLIQWHAALKGSRFEGQVPKTFRSTVGTLTANENDLEAAQGLLGHAQKATTERSYRKRSVRAPDVTATLEAFNVLPQNRE